MRSCDVDTYGYHKVTDGINHYSDWESVQRSDSGGDNDFRKSVRDNKRVHDSSLSEISKGEMMGGKKPQNCITQEFRILDLDYEIPTKCNWKTTKVLSVDDQ